MINPELISEFKSANNKFRRGDAIGNGELNLLIKRYSGALDYMDLFGPEYTLAANELRRHLATLESFQHARKEN